MKKVTKEVTQKTKKASTNFLLGALAVSVVILAIVVAFMGTNMDNRSDAKEKGNRGDPPRLEQKLKKSNPNPGNSELSPDTKSRSSIKAPAVDTPSEKTDNYGRR